MLHNINSQLKELYNEHRRGRYDLFSVKAKTLFLQMQKHPTLELILASLKLLEEHADFSTTLMHLVKALITDATTTEREQILEKRVYNALLKTYSRALKAHAAILSAASTAASVSAKLHANKLTCENIRTLLNLLY